MHTTPIRQFACENCGAPQQGLGDGLVVMCERCGSYVGLQTGALMDPERLAKTTAESLESFFAPTEIQARQTEASVRMAAAQAAGDKGQWRLWAKEYYALLSLEPHNEGGAPKDPARRAEWMEQCLAMSEVTTFDPGMQALNQRNGEAMSALYQSERPIAAARAALEAGIEVQRYLDQHPDVPDSLQTTSAEHRARESLRMVLATAVTFLGDKVVARIRTEVLGDEAVSGDGFACLSCGGLIEGASGHLTCPYCGALTERAGHKGWRQRSLDQWRASSQSYPGDNEQAGFALQFVISAWQNQKELPPVSEILTFLQAGPGWLPASVLTQMAEALAMAYDAPELRACLSELAAALAHWQPIKSKPEPPAPAAKPEFSEDHTFDENDPWIRQTLAMWDLERQNNPNASDLGSSAVGLVMSPFYMGGSVDPRQALAFLALIQPQPPADEVASFARIMRDAAAAPAANEVLEAIIEAYDR